MKSIAIFLPVYNSHKNLEKIISNLYKIKNYKKKIYIIDNNSNNISKKEKIYLLKKIQNKHKNINLKLVINKQDYGIGGSMKIFFNLIKKKNYNYILSLITSGRFNSKNLVSSLNKNIAKENDFIIFSRFYKRGTAKNYNTLRYIFNIFFINLTKILTGSKLSDPGSIVMLIKKKLIYKIAYEKITNGSHFGHFFNVLMSMLNVKILELPIIWKEGNVKSHLNSLSYVTILFASLVKFFLTKSFFINKENKFKYDLINF